jgi:hypothetical protein
VLVFPEGLRTKDVVLDGLRDPARWHTTIRARSDSDHARLSTAPTVLEDAGATEPIRSSASASDADQGEEDERSTEPPQLSRDRDASCTCRRRSRGPDHDASRGVRPSRGFVGYLTGVRAGRF